MSALNVGEGARHRFALRFLIQLGAAGIVPWPVYAEAALLLTGRGLVLAAVRLGRSLHAGELTLAVPTEFEHAQALAIVERYAGFGLDLPDAVCISMAVARRLPLLTWDFRHARAVVLSGSAVELLVAEHELPRP